MIWTKQDIIKSIVRKPKHKPQFNLGREIHAEILDRIKAGEEVRVDEIAAKLAEGYKDLLSQHPDLYSERYASLPITYHPKNPTPENELKDTKILRIVDGIDFLLASRNGRVEDIGSVDLCIYLRDHNCPYDHGNFNAQILVSQIRILKPFYVCPKKKEKLKHCGAMGRTGYLLELR